MKEAASSKQNLCAEKGNIRMPDVTTIKMNDLITFTVDPNRRVQNGGDGGPTVEALVDGVLALRWDCFKKPHYHYFHKGVVREGERDLGEQIWFDVVLTGTERDCLPWVLLYMIAPKLSDMLRHAGYDEAADSVNTDDVARVVYTIQEAVNATPLAA